MFAFHDKVHLYVQMDVRDTESRLMSLGDVWNEKKNYAWNTANSGLAITENLDKGILHLTKVQKRVLQLCLMAIKIIQKTSNFLILDWTPTNLYEMCMVCRVYIIIIPYIWILSGATRSGHACSPVLVEMKRVNILKVANLLKIQISVVAAVEGFGAVLNH